MLLVFRLKGSVEAIRDLSRGILVTNSPRVGGEPKGSRFWYFNTKPIDSGLRASIEVPKPAFRPEKLRAIRQLEAKLSWRSIAQ